MKSRLFMNKMSVFCCFLALVMSCEAFDVDILSVDEQAVHVAVQSDTNSYYFMYGAPDVTQAMPILDISLGAENEIQFLDTRHTTNKVFFYKAAKVDVEQPADVDGDLIDDVFELGQSFLHPLQAADALLDQDMDGYSNLREYQTGANLTNRYLCPNPPWVHAEGKYLVNEWGERVLMQGVNIGGCFVHEDWMDMINLQSSEDVWAKLVSRFGGPAATNLMNVFWDNYFQASDLDVIKDQGYNHIRLPFLASLLADEGSPYLYKTSGWARLDWIVGECAKRGLYCVLDMHGTQGGNNPFPHSGFSDDRNELWTNTEFQAQFVAMWVEIARHFETNSAVLAYELCNEPDPPGPSKIWSFHNLMLPIYRRAYSAIRSNDTQHLIIMMDNFCGLDQFPDPADELWTNVIYAAHHYENVVLDKDLSFDVQKENGKFFFRQYSEWMETRDVPMYIGEFMSGTAQNMDYFIRQFRAHEINMAHWNFKIWEKSPEAWGLLYRTEWWNDALKPDLDVDDYATLSNKFSHYATVGNYSPNQELQHVVRNNTYYRPPRVGERADFYNNTFNGPNWTNQSVEVPWPFKKAVLTEENYLMNPGFEEENPNDWGELVDWSIESTIWNSAWAANVLTRRGFRSASVRSQDAGSVNEVRLVQVHPARVDQQWRGSMYATEYWDMWDAYWNKQYGVRLCFLASNLSTIEVVAVTNSCVQPSGKYHWVGVDGQAPANTAYVKIELFFIASYATADSGQMFFDDAVLSLFNAQVCDHKVRALTRNEIFQAKFCSREEALARFEINDATGCWFNVDIDEIGTTNTVSNPGGVVTMGAFRDDLQESSWQHDTAGVMAKLLYDATNALPVNVQLWSKSGGTNSAGTLLYESGAIAFQPGAGLELFVNDSSCEIKYNGASLWSGIHGLVLDRWPNGAVAVVEAEDLSSGGITYVDMDNFKAWRPVVSPDDDFTDDFTGYPDGQWLGAEPEYWSIYNYVSAAWNSPSFIQTNALRWIPEEWNYGGTWLNPRRNYQNDVRMDITGGQVVEVAVVLREFNHGIMKLCLLPEYLPGWVWSDYDSSLLFVEFSNDDAGNLTFDFRKQNGVNGSSISLALVTGISYVEGQAVSLQLNATHGRIYYGSNLLINEPHTVTCSETYPDGMFMHLEYANEGDTTDASVRIDNVECRQREAFQAPE